MASPDRYARYTLALIGAMLVFRVAMLFLNPAGLHGDEAQYWAWSLDPDFGYYSKPPLIAWIIWLTTSLFGHEEWAVRLASPFLHSLTAWLTFLTARRLFDAQAGLLASALYLLMPGVSLSASLISTDAALLVFVALALYAWVRLRDDPDWGGAVLLGIAIGLGFLAKYAMAFTLPAIGLAVLFEPKTRKALLHARGLFTGAIAVLVVLPNLIWNAGNDFATLSHTGDNANLGDGPQINPLELLEFLLGQLGVFGPITFPLLVVALWTVLRQRSRFNVWLALLVLTPLLIISVQALISRANANWAAAAYAAAPVLLAGWIVATGRWRWVKAGLAVNLFLAIVPALVLTSPALVNTLGFANAVKRQRAWPETVEAIKARHDPDVFEAIAVDNRLVFYDLLYYGIEEVAPLRMWRYEPSVSNHAELTQALPEGPDAVLLVSFYHETYEPYFEADFERIEPLGIIEIPLGGGKVRRLKTYRARGYSGPRIRPD